MSKERPILFSGSMVRAILEGRKTQTRRIVKIAGHAATDEDIPAQYEDGSRDPFVMDFSGPWYPQWRRKGCPYGKPGDRLWVRETWCPDHEPYEFRYRADGSEVVERWRPSIHMPRWASRIALEVVSVRVERLQDCSEEDAVAEGITLAERSSGPVAHYAALWDSINGLGSWNANPWVWVVEFKRVK